MGVAQSLPRPPRGATPGEMYGGYLPALWSAFRAGLPPFPVTVTVAVEVGAEAFTGEAGPGGLAVSEGRVGDPLFTCTCTLEDFRGGARDVLPIMLRRVEKVLPRLRAAAGAAETRLASLDLDQLRHRPGQIDAELTDDAGEVLRATYKVGSGRGPRVLVRLDDAELDSLVQGTGRISRLIGSRIRAEGDVAYLVQLLAFIEGTTARLT